MHSECLPYHWAQTPDPKHPCNPLETGKQLGKLPIQRIGYMAEKLSPCADTRGLDVLIITSKTLIQNILR